MTSVETRSAAARPRGQRGFTLVDLALTLAVLAVVSAFTLSAAVDTMKTYQRNLGARHVLSELRRTQSLAVTRGDIFALQWGGAPSVALLPGHYRIVRDVTGSCGLPLPIAAPDGENVVTGWSNLADQFSEVTIRSIRDRDDHPVDHLMFDAMGASVNTCAPVSFPVTITVAGGAGRKERIEVSRSGVARLL